MGKMYMEDNIPNICSDCSLTAEGKCQLLDKDYCIENCRRHDCPLCLLKDHDRELVRKVCEKIRNELKNEMQKGPETYVAIANVFHKINRVLGQIEEEYE